MPIRNLSKIFEPKCGIVVIGPIAPKSASSIPRTAYANILSGGFEGPVWVVDSQYDGDAISSGNEDEDESMGDDTGIDEQRRVLSGIDSIPDSQVPDLALICTDEEVIPQTIRQCGEKGILGIIILSWGKVLSRARRFDAADTADTDMDGSSIEDRIQQEAACFDGMRILGPNSLGVLIPKLKLNASYAVTPGIPRDGSVAFISQSSRLCNSVLDWAAKENVGFAHVVSLGNTSNVTTADCIDYFATRYWVRSLVLYVESISSARDFMSAARSFSQKKPIIVYKAGRFEQSAEVSMSYTGELAGVDDVYDAAFRRAGCVRVDELDDVFDCAELLAKHDPPRGSNLAIVTNAGGPGVMATDALLSRNGVLAKLDERTTTMLNELAPPGAAMICNPIDVTGRATPHQFGSFVGTVLHDDSVDAALVILAPHVGADLAETARAIIKAARAVALKPVLAVCMGGDTVEEARNIFNQELVPTYSSPEAAVRAFMYLVSYGRTKETLYETPKEVPVTFSHDRTISRSIFDCVAHHGEHSGSNVLSEKASKTLIEAYGIPTAKPIIARTAEDARWHANQLGYPVAMKVESPNITKKTAVGGVVLNVSNEDEVLSTFDHIIARAREHRPDAQINGVNVQKQKNDPLGLQFIVGAKRDPTFGSVVLFGIGGLAASMYKSAVELPPLTERLARGMLESLNIWPLLNGAQGQELIDVDSLIEILIRVSYLIADFPEIQELDINPLLISPMEAVALDARIIVNSDLMGKAQRPYSHLAIRPYPEEFQSQVTLKNSAPVLLRPIKPEDENEWHRMISRCSNQSKMSRFFHTFKDTTHEMASRYCFIDYDREIAIVAEVEESDSKKALIGVGRLVANSDHTNAEYAVIVIDKYQGLGLGTMLTNYCMDIATEWGIKTVVAETSPNNHRMLSLFSRKQFVLNRTLSSDIVVCRKDLE
mmetsp:Transcript_29498/g.65410  ORF Transcript_29498/g.65410 Transcript_29498/m.65410 type:complete len:942 (+) Transcript_29498:128-2953(+)